MDKAGITRRRINLDSECASACTIASQSCHNRKNDLSNQGVRMISNSLIQQTRGDKYNTERSWQPHELSASTKQGDNSSL